MPDFDLLDAVAERVFGCSYGLMSAKTKREVMQMALDVRRNELLATIQRKLTTLARVALNP